jgi:hypothetical protein
LRAYSDGVDRTNEEIRERENQIRKFMVPLVPAIAQYDPKQHLSHASILALVWLSAMRRYMEYHKMGIEMLAIRYANWRSMPQETADAMLVYCQCRPADMTRVFDSLTRDSQAGTVLAQEVVKKQDRKLDETDLNDLRQHLKAHAFINEAGFELANTLKM